MHRYHSPAAAIWCIVIGAALQVAGLGLLTFPLWGGKAEAADTAVEPQPVEDLAAVEADLAGAMLAGMRVLAGWLLISFALYASGWLVTLWGLIRLALEPLIAMQETILVRALAGQAR